MILIAEPDRQVRKLQQHFLGEAGFEVAFAEEGESALSRVRLQRPTLLVTEILLPRVDGLTLCRRIREDPLTRTLPILVFSILAAEVRAREAGANAFLRKPLVDPVFVATIRQLITGSADTKREQRWATT